MLFILVLVVVLATPFVLGLGGVDVREAGAADTDGTGPGAGDGGVVVLNANGETGGFGDASVGVVRLVVTKNGTGPAINPTTMTATWTTAGNSYVLAAAENAGSGAEGTFDVSVTGPSGSSKLNESGDRATLTFDVGTDDVEGADEFGQRLQPGDTVTLQLTTDDGTTTTVTLRVPNDAGGKRVVSL